MYVCMYFSRTALNTKLRLVEEEANSQKTCIVETARSSAWWPSAATKKVPVLSLLSSAGALVAP